MIEMEENLKELQAYFMVYHNLSLNQDQILDVIHNVRKYDSVKKDSLFRVIDIVSKVFCVSVNDIKSKSRKYPLPDARKCFCHLCSMFEKDVHYKKVTDYINRDKTLYFNYIDSSKNLLDSDVNYHSLLNRCYIFLQKNVTLTNQDR